MEASPAAPQGYVPRLKQIYADTVRPKMIEEFGYKNALAVPRLDKIVLNNGRGRSGQRHQEGDERGGRLCRLIAGQKPVITHARRADRRPSKVRENMPLGAKVTLRHTRMYEFLDRLITIALAARPRFSRVEPQVLRRARGISRSGSRNISFFPRSTTTRPSRCWEWTSSSAPRPRRSDEARALLRAFNFPFRQ